MLLFRSKYYVDTCLFWCAFTMTLLLGVQDGILLAIGCSLLSLLFATARPVCHVLGVLPGTNLWGELARFPDAAGAPGVLAFRFGASLHFANKDFFMERLLAAEAEVNGGALAPAGAAAPDEGAVEAGTARVRCVIVDAGAVQAVDSSSIKMLALLAKNYAASGTKLSLAGLAESVKCQILNDGELLKQLKAVHGVPAAETELGDGRAVGLFFSINEALEYHRATGSIARALPERPRALTADGKFEFAERNDTLGEGGDAAQDEMMANPVGLRQRAKSKAQELVVAHTFDGSADV